jgi:hypothetical protein
MWVAEFACWSGLSVLIFEGRCDEVRYEAGIHMAIHGQVYPPVPSPCDSIDCIAGPRAAGADPGGKGRMESGA